MLIKKVYVIFTHFLFRNDMIITSTFWNGALIVQTWHLSGCVSKFWYVKAIKCKLYLCSVWEKWQRVWSFSLSGVYFIHKSWIEWICSNSFIFWSTCVVIQQVGIFIKFNSWWLKYKSEDHHDLSQESKKVDYVNKLCLIIFIVLFYTKVSWAPQIWLAGSHPKSAER